MAVFAKEDEEGFEPNPVENFQRKLKLLENIRVDLNNEIQDLKGQTNLQNNPRLDPLIERLDIVIGDLKHIVDPSNNEPVSISEHKNPASQEL